jgi:hypothetical protein
MPLSDHEMKPGQQPRRLTEDDYHQLLEAFRHAPGKHREVARACGVGAETARRAWHEGWPDRGWPAIRAVYEDEGLLARAQRVKKQQAEELMAREEMLARQAQLEAEARVKAREDAVLARSQEGQMVALSRANTIALQSAAARLMRAAVREAKALDEELEKGTTTLTPAQRVKFIGNVAYLNESAVRAAKINIEMERQLLGEPTEVVGVAVKDMTLDDAARTVIVAGRAMKRAARRGMIDQATMVALQQELMAANEDVIDADPESIMELPAASVEAHARAVLGPDDEDLDADLEELAARDDEVDVA